MKYYQDETKLLYECIKTLYFTCFHYKSVFCKSFKRQSTVKFDKAALVYRKVKGNLTMVIENHILQ